MMFTKMLNDVSLRGRLIAGFAVVLVLTWVVGLAALHRITGIFNIAQTVYEHPLAVSNAVLEAKAEITVVQGLIDHLLVVTNPHEADRLKQKIASSRDHIREFMAIVETQFLGPSSDVAEANAAIARWNNAYDELMPLLDEGELNEARMIYSARMKELETYTNIRLSSILTFARAKAAELSRNAVEHTEVSIREVVGLLIALTVFGLLASVVVIHSITGPLAKLRDRMLGLADGDMTAEIPYLGLRNELGRMAGAVQVFRESSRRLADERWLKSEVAALSTALQSAESPERFAVTLLDRLVPHLHGALGLFYLRGEATGRYALIGGYGGGPHAGMEMSFAPGEGLVGQSALSRRPIYISDVPEGYLAVRSGLGAARPTTLAIIPVSSRDDIPAVLEIGGFADFTDLQKELLVQALPMIALNLGLVLRNFKTRQLLEQTRLQAERLAASEQQLTAQAEELQEANGLLRAQAEELETQTEELKASEEEMRVQQEQLRAVNEELSEKTTVLEEQATTLKATQAEAEQRAVELTLASRYKSEFLANMSHELRTPLNSLLILAKSLAGNETGNLTDDQVESADIIHDSGAQLLNLINDILDIAKVESGKMRVAAQDVPLPGVADTIDRRFKGMARVKGLKFSVVTAPDLPDIIRTDGGKLEQILNNLVGNAIKFTDQGTVTVTFHSGADGADNACPPLPGPRAERVVISVSDTGIGISENLIDRVFMAFEQGDGSTSRRFGGTGLGLSIARKLARLLGGDIFVKSAEGRGSTFTLILPAIAPMPELAAAETIAAAPGPDVARHGPAAPRLHDLPSPFIPDDRDVMTPGDKALLVIDDDRHFARIAANMVREKGFKCLVAGDGEAGIVLAARFRPAGIILDIGLPGVDGWSVMVRLRAAAETESIPIHVISAFEGDERARELGAIGFLNKPVSAAQIEQALARIVKAAGRKAQRLVVADADPEARKAVARVVALPDVEIVEAADSEAVLDQIRQRPVDCLVLDVDLPGGGLALMEAVSRDKALILPPVIIMAARELSRDETIALRGYTDSIIVKAGRSEERLLNEVRLFLHSVRAALPVAERPLPRLQVAELPELAGRTVLVVDDDMRNSFALSKVLRMRGLRVLLAQDGLKALKQLEDNPDIDYVIMDIMMPGMDGYEAMREIRKDPRHADLPIIAVTAKAMAGDREKCVEAGATDYLSKPVDIDILITMLTERTPA